MMTHATFEERLDDYMDGRLDETATREMEGWLEAHPEDRAQVERARALQAAVADLPRRVEPDRDLWPAVRAGIEQAASGASRPAATAARTAARRTGWPAWIGIAASLVVLVGGALIGLRLLGGGAGPDTGATPTLAVDRSGPAAATPGDSLLQAAADTLPAEGVDAELQAAEEEFLRATLQLMEVLEARRDQIPPENLQFVEENLKTINEAIDDMRSALRSDPGNPVHGHALAAMYQKKMQLLWMASRLSEES